MPELPEVQTVVDDLNRRVKGRKILRVWSDTPKQIRDYSAPGRRLTDLHRDESSKNFRNFQKDIKNKKILRAKRIGKNILIDLSGGKTLLIHQKMTGHLLLGEWAIKKGRPVAIKPKEMVKDPYNGFIHLILYLDNGKQLALSDLRKFAKAILADTKKIHDLPDIKNLGPDALDPSLTLKKFANLIKKSGPTIKQALLKPELVAGIGNIYSDDILYQSFVHPLQNPKKLTPEEISKMYKAMRQVLKKAVRLRGTSTSDFRDTAGKEGRYTNHRLVYGREGEPCQRCQTPIKRIKVGGRSASFCPKCQAPKRTYNGKKKKKRN